MNTHMHSITISIKEEVINLKKTGFMGGFGGRKRKEKYCN